MQFDEGKGKEKQMEFANPNVELKPGPWSPEQESKPVAYWADELEAEEQKQEKAKRLVAVNTSGLEPAGRAVLVQTYEPEIKSSIIALPDQVKNRMDMVNQRATVVAVGETAWFDEPSPRARVGDRVLITRFAGFMAGADVTADGKTYRLVNDRDIFCRIVKEKE